MREKLKQKHKLCSNYFVLLLLGGLRSGFLNLFLIFQKGVAGQVTCSLRQKVVLNARPGRYYVS